MLARASWLKLAATFAAGVTVGIMLMLPQTGRQSAVPLAPQVIAACAPTTADSPLPAPRAANAAEPAETVITRVIDGDTVELADGRKVRYIGIDAPEMSKRDCFAAESKAANELLVLNRRARLERDITDTDRFGRLLRYVYVGDTFVNLQLLADGFAQLLTYPPDVRYNEQLRAATAEARQAKRGLWSGCSASPEPAVLPNPRQPAPSEDSINLYDRAQSFSGGELPPAGCTIKGNINAKGEKIYHLPGCGSYKKTTIDETRGEQWFCSEADASAAGWRKAGNCP